MLAQGKQGVGLVLDLGADRAVSQVELSLLTGGGKLELRAAPEGSTEIPDAIDQWAVVQAVDSPEQKLDVTFDTPVTTRYVLVWFTELPTFEDTLKDGIFEAVLRGA
jgi:putative peptidoglycan lipid II flippase